MFRLSFYPIADSYLLVCGAAVALAALMILGPARSRTTRRRRTALAALRVAVILLVVLAMLRPTLVYTETEKEAATLVVLGDRSRSMLVPDEGGGRTRWEALRRTLTGAQDALGELAEDFEIQAYTFDAEAHPADVADGRIQLPEAPDGQQTAIGSVLEDVLRQQAGKRLLGIILLSDGAQRARPPRDVLPQTAAGQLRPLGVPLFTLRFGKARGLGQAQDVAVKDLLANQYVFVKNELTVTGQVRIDGYVDQEVPVRLLVETSPGKMEPVAEQTLKASADGELMPVQFDYVPQLPGEYRISLEAVGQQGELATTNNRLSTFVNVLKGGLNVLYLEGERRPEVAFLRRTLGASREIKVEYLYVDPRRPESRPANFAERLKPGKYEVYILGDLHSSVFRDDELADLADAVSKGAGLIMIGGLHSFGPGGYADTRLADVLPIRMDRLERQGLDEDPSKDLHLTGPVKMSPSRDGLRHFALRLGASQEESAAVWARLPPLDGANRFRREALKPAAIVLAEAEGLREQPPLLVEQVYGRGRVMAFAGDTTGRWCMRGFGTAHKRFWRQIVLWLARKDEALEGQVRIKLPQRRFNPGQRVEFSVEAQSADGGSVEGAEYEVEIELPDGSTQPLRLASGDDQMTGSVRDTQAPGDYTLRATVTQGGQLLGEAKSRFLVSEQDLELDNAAADATVLESLAAMTGGRSLVPEELPELVRRLTEDTQSLEVRRETKRPLWDTWGFLFLLVGLLGSEWYLRKRWGLV